MARTYFEETQRFRDNPWLMTVLITIMLLAVSPLMYGLYTQLVMGQPWGDKPMRDSHLIWVSITVFLAVGIGILVMMTMKLELRITTDVIEFRVAPFLTRKWKTINRSEIEKYMVEKKWRPFGTGGFGRHRNIFNKTQSIKLHGLWHLYLKLHDGRSFYFGTSEPQNLEYAMQKLFKDDIE